MQNLFIYLLKVSVCYAAIYVFYIVLLRRVTHYTGNRFFLLGSSLIAFFIPLFRVDLFVAPKTIAHTSIIKYIPNLTASATRKLIMFNDSSANGVNIFIGLFICGAIICCILFFTQLFSLKKITAKAKLIDETAEIRLYQLDSEIMPFSFGNRIYINKNMHAADELEKIIQHESVHVRQKHTLDVLAMELVCILNWYNPFAWLIKKVVKQNLEFLADDVVIRNGADKKSYQYLLLKTTGYSGLNLASKLNFSSLKKRIYMMNKTRNSNKHLFKFLFVLPVIMLIVFAFRNGNSVSTYSPEQNSNEETFQLSKVTYSVNEAHAKALVEKAQNESLLKAGNPFTVTSMKNERDRLKMLLEKNGYGHITSHTITFLIDSSLTNNSFAVQINIDLQEKALLLKGSDKQTGNLSRNYSIKTLYDLKNVAQAGVTLGQLQAKM